MQVVDEREGDVLIYIYTLRMHPCPSQAEFNYRLGLQNRKRFVPRAIFSNCDATTTISEEGRIWSVELWPMLTIKVIQGNNRYYWRHNVLFAQSRAVLLRMVDAN